ncbi:MAG: FHA domain-containing protein [Planctomycetales bacterium]|nr:FHA domain-containing protein [Planctomycetales bacterium]
MARRYMRHDSHVVKRGPGQLRVALEILRGRAVRRMRPIDGPASLIGSAPDCDLVLGDARFPEVHSYVRVTDGQVTIRHLGFSPDLLVNGQPATLAILRDGDVIQMGPYYFGVRIGFVPLDQLPDGQEADIETSAAPAVCDDDRVGMSKSRSLLADIRHVLDAHPPHMRVFGPVHVGGASRQQRRDETTAMFARRSEPR